MACSQLGDFTDQWMPELSARRGLASKAGSEQWQGGEGSFNTPVSRIFLYVFLLKYLFSALGLIFSGFISCAGEIPTKSVEIRPVISAASSPPLPCCVILFLYRNFYHVAFIRPLIWVSSSLPSPTCFYDGSVLYPQTLKNCFKQTESPLPLTRTALDNEYSPQPPLPLSPQMLETHY